VALTAGSEADSILVLLDRSASMEQKDPRSERTKRATALAKISDLLKKTVHRSQIVLIDSATLSVTEISKPEDLLDLPVTEPTDTAADIPALLQTALDYIATNQSGRTDVWLASDLRASDWEVASGRWENLRAAFSGLEGLRFYLLNYPSVSEDNLSVSVKNLRRRNGPEGTDLLMDLTIRRSGKTELPGTLKIPVEFTVNGTRTMETMAMEGNRLSLLGYTISLGGSEPRGWGRVDLPADSNGQDNTCFFVFGEAPVFRTTILSDDRQVTQAIRSAAESPVDSTQHY